VGIDTPEIRLVCREQVESLPEQAWAGGSHAYAVKRFDRGPQRELIHIEDMAQVRGFYPEQKYWEALKP
jgi:serine/threonine-protein kinase HipA